MPTVITHAIVPLVLGGAIGRERISVRLRVTGALAAMLPDADVLAFAFDITYADAFGHRGASHSLAFALATGAVAALFAQRLHARPRAAFAWIVACTASHPLLDMLTNGGLGVALWWPASDARVFAPWQPVEVSPIGAGFFSLRGVAVLLSELRWIWLPAFAITALIAVVRRAQASR